MADDRYLLQCARRRRTLTAGHLASQLCAAAGRSISRQTVSRRVHEGVLFARRPVDRVPLSPMHVRAWLHWAREYRSWTPEQWGHFLFMDESRINIQNESRRAIIWREPGTRYRAPNIVETDHYRGGRLLAWAGIATNCRTDLYVFTGGSVTVVRYCDEILLPLCGLLSLQWIPTRNLWAITPDRIENDWCGVIWRVKPFHTWRGLLDRRT
ncbi:hypothetical protein AVEN_202740-1 [Araneus ventricosus]|uniref:Transposase Tc1-like domain-containing protein n=1 Tax=Araneus ventricosus TaxID=182803 RepID=A0A4Y2K6M5_ARAVE|nr:hypothetical protein AVEN_202740-1 [Araneus ventricosus]